MIIGTFTYMLAGYKQEEVIDLPVPDAEDVSALMSDARMNYDEVFTDTLYELRDMGAQDIEFKENEPNRLY